MRENSPVSSAAGGGDSAVPCACWRCACCGRGAPGCAPYSMCSRLRVGDSPCISGDTAPGSCSAGFQGGRSAQRGEASLELSHCVNSLGKTLPGGACCPPRGAVDGRSQLPVDGRSSHSLRSGIGRWYTALELGRRGCCRRPLSYSQLPGPNLFPHCSGMRVCAVAGLDGDESTTPLDVHDSCRLRGIGMAFTRHVVLSGSDIIPSSGGGL